jgi:hypothetical protein
MAEYVIAPLLTGNSLGCVCLVTRQELFQVSRETTAPVRQFPVWEASRRRPAANRLLTGSEELHDVSFGVDGKNLESTVRGKLIQTGIVLD